MNCEKESIIDRSMSALELADAFISSAGVAGDPDEVERTQNAVMLAAEHVAETAEPGSWEEFDAVDFFRKIDFLSDHEREGIALSLMGFFGWMGMTLLMQPGIAMAALESTAKVVSTNICNTFLESAKGPLSTAEEIWPTYMN